MATYKFPQFNLEIVNPIVTLQIVHDFIQERVCNVDVVLATDTATFGVTFSGYTYVLDWNDQDITNWVNNVELPQYEVKL